MARKLGTRLLFCVSALGLLAGCALPLPLQIASWAADGISFITTRKSLADHGLSLIAQKDCAIWRGIVGGTICVTDDAGTIAVASAAPKVHVKDITTRRNSPPRPAPVTHSPSISPPPIPQRPIPQRIDPGLVFSDKNIAGIKTFVTASGVAEAEDKESNSAQKLNPEIPITIVPPPPARTKKVRQVADRFYVIGRFMRASSAKHMAVSYTGLGPEVIEIKAANRRIFKVMVGPFSRDNQDEIKGHILRLGINDVRVAHMDGSGRFVARYYSIASYTDKRSAPKTVSRLHIDVVVTKVALFTRYKMALLRFLGV